MRTDATLLALQRAQSVDPSAPIYVDTSGLRPSEAGGADNGGSWTRIDLVNSENRILSISLPEERYTTDYVVIYLDNSDGYFQGADSGNYYHNYWFKIGRGCDGEVSYPAYQRCIGHNITSPDSVFVLYLEGAWNILQRFIASEDYYYNQPDLDPTLDNMTHSDICEHILQLAGLDLGSAIGLLDGKFTTWTPKVDFEHNYNGIQGVLRTLSPTKCVLVPEKDYMRPKYIHDITGTATSTSTGKLVDSGATFSSEGVVAGNCVYNSDDGTYSRITSVDSETQLTLEDDIFVSGEAYEVVDDIYVDETDGKFLPYEKGSSSSMAFSPMKVKVNKYDDDTVNGSDADDDWDDSMGYYVYDDAFEVATNAADCQFIAEAEMARRKIDSSSGILYPSRANCLQEIMDKVLIVDSEGNITGVNRICGIFFTFNEEAKVLAMELRLGGTRVNPVPGVPGLQTDGVTGKIPASEITGKLPVSVLRNAMGKYTCDIEPDPTNASYTWEQVKWLAGTIYFQDTGKTLDIDAGTLNITTEGYGDNPVLLYFIEGNSTLQHTDDWTEAVGKDRDVIAIVQRAEDTTSSDKASWDGHTGKVGVLNTRILLTNLLLAQHIRAGELVLGGKVTGNLDNVDNGSTYGKVLLSILSGGAIRVGSGTKDSDLDGWMIDSNEIVSQVDGSDVIVLDKTNGRISFGVGTYFDEDGIHINESDKGSISLIVTGSYTGNGSSSGRDITTGFKCSFVIIYGLDYSDSDNSAAMWFLTSVNNAMYIISNPTIDSTSIICLDSTDGFNVGNAQNIANVSGIPYTYIAFG